VTVSDPKTANRARSLLFASSRLAVFGLETGLDCSFEVLFHPSVIERFVLVSRFSAPTRRTVRTNLRFMAKRVLLCADPGSLQMTIAISPSPAPLSRERAKTPYSESEIAAYLALADAQPTRLRRMRANALICLSAGAGLTGSDLRHVRGSDVVCRSGGVLVCVSGGRKRIVPVLREYHERLLCSAEFFCDHYLVCGSDPNRHNVTTPLISALSGGTDLGRLSVARLRATWLSCLAGQIGLKAFMDAAGITCSQRLGDLVSHLDPVDETAAVVLLGGRS
jgi:integrase